jgi:arginine exporter protein ArgO
VIAGYGIAIPIGPIGILILEVGIQRGFKTAFSAGAGAASADLIYATIASLAGAFLVSLLEPYASPLRIASGIVLIGFGMLLFYHGSRERGKRRKELGTVRQAHTYGAFLGLTLFNPLTVAYFTTLILGLRAGTTYSSINILLFIVGAFSASLSWQTLLAGLGGLGHKRMSSRLQFATLAIGNSVVIVLGFLILIGFPI